MKGLVLEEFFAPLNASLAIGDPPAAPRGYIETTFAKLSTQQLVVRTFAGR